MNSRVYMNRKRAVDLVKTVEARATGSLSTPLLFSASIIVFLKVIDSSSYAWLPVRIRHSSQER